MRTGLLSGRGRWLLPPSLVWLMLLSGASSALAGTPETAREPAESVPGSPEAIQESTESIKAPPTMLPVDESPVRYLILREISSEIPGDKGSLFTDGGEGLLPTGPTSLEQAKLDMARAAVEAARASGNIFLRPAADTGTLSIPPDVEKAKLERVQTTTPPLLPPDPAAGSGVPISPLQENGPVGLTAQEQAKIDGTIPPPAAGGTDVPPESKNAGTEGR
jgi:hypothetical protein